MKNAVVAGEASRTRVVVGEHIAAIAATTGLAAAMTIGFLVEHRDGDRSSSILRRSLTESSRSPL